MAVSEIYHYGFTGPIGAHPVNRTLPDPIGPQAPPDGGAATPLAPNDVRQFNNNRTYALLLDGGHPLQDAAIQGASGMRPYVLVTSSATEAAKLVPVSGAPRKFRIEGLWIGSGNDSVGDVVVERATPALETFDWDEIVIRGATLDPGGVRANGSDIAPLRLWIWGRVRSLVIESSIVGAVHVRRLPSTTDSGFIEELVIRDSVVDATLFEPGPGDPLAAISNITGRTTLERVTVLGDIEAAVLRATDSVVMGQLHVLNQHDSCFRFSAATAGGTVPTLFESLVDPDVPIEPFFFTSLHFGDPGYAQLSLKAPETIVRGGENGSEMGAFSSLLRPIHLSSVINKVDEFQPVGIFAQYIFQGESATGALPSESE
jgi:hypothetical protein